VAIFHYYSHIFGVFALEDTERSSGIYFRPQSSFFAAIPKFDRYFDTSSGRCVAVLRRICDVVQTSPPCERQVIALDLYNQWLWMYSFREREYLS